MIGTMFPMAMSSDIWPQYEIVGTKTNMLGGVKIFILERSLGFFLEKNDVENKTQSKIWVFPQYGTPKWMANNGKPY